MYRAFLFLLSLFLVLVFLKQLFVASLFSASQLPWIQTGRDEAKILAKRQSSDVNHRNPAAILIEYLPNPPPGSRHTNKFDLGATLKDTPTRLETAVCSKIHCKPHSR